MDEIDENSEFDETEEEDEDDTPLKFDALLKQKNQIEKKDIKEAF